MKLLIISHDASRTGAPILLLHFLEALKRRNPSIRIETILVKDGDLTPRFNAVGKVLVLRNPRKRTGVAGKIIRKYRNLIKDDNYEVSNRERILDFIGDVEYDVIFSNTITNGHILKTIKHKSARLITYVHELENAIARFTDPKALAFTLKSTTYYLVPSAAVKKNLIQRHNVDEAKVSNLNYYIPERDFKHIENPELRSTLNLNGCFVVGGMGTSDWRKGIDLFLLVAIQVKIHAPATRVKFMWVGVNKESESYRNVMYDAVNAGIADDIILVENVNNPLEYLSVMDTFLLTSREDPYPLVVLEAAMLKKPVVCFANAGGAAEFVTRGGGIVVPFLDVYKMAAELTSLLQNSEARSELGAKAYKSYKEIHAEDVTLPVLENILAGKLVDI